MPQLYACCHPQSYDSNDQIQQSCCLFFTGWVKIFVCETFADWAMAL